MLKLVTCKLNILTLFRMDIFSATHGWMGAILANICHTYPTTMKLGTVIPHLKKIQKLYESRDTPPEFCWHQHLFIENQQILLYQEIQIQIAFWYIISIFLTFLESLKIFLINVVLILMMSAKMATPGLLKIKVFWNKGFYVIYFLYDVTNKILSYESSYIMDVAMWPKFRNSGIRIREVIITSTL